MSYPDTSVAGPRKGRTLTFVHTYTEARCQGLYRHHLPNIHMVEMRKLELTEVKELTPHHQVYLK